MKKLAALALTTMLALSLAACATSSKSGGTMKVKCPACGYQFEVPSDGRP